MNTIYCIQYVDAFYTYGKSIAKSKLSVHEAHGYIEENTNNIIISYIRMKRSGGEVETALGLVIPKMALLSKKDANNRKKLAGLNTGMSVAVTWQDIIIFDTADQRRECPVMYTEGVLFRIENDQLVLKNPETITMPPSILKNHPQEKPNFYVIPIALITEIVDIS